MWVGDVNFSHVRKVSVSNYFNFSREWSSIFQQFLFPFYIYADEFLYLFNPFLCIQNMDKCQNSELKIKLKTTLKVYVPTYGLHRRNQSFASVDIGFFPPILVVLRFSFLRCWTFKWKTELNCWSNQVKMYNPTKLIFIFECVYVCVRTARMLITKSIAKHVNSNREFFKADMLIMY